MKRLLFIIFILINCSLGFCAKNEITGTDMNSLDQITELDFWFNIDTYKIGEFKPSYHTTLYDGKIYADDVKISFCSNENNKKVINKITCTFNEEKIDEILDLLNKNHYLESKKDEYDKTVYTFYDKKTKNKAIAEEYNYRLVLTYKSGKYENSTFIENQNNYSKITGADGFTLYMSKKEALKKAELNKYIIVYETNINSINRIWFRKETSKSDYWLERTLKSNVKTDPFIDENGDYCCIDFVLNNGDYMLANYYKTIVWKSDSANNITSQSIYTDFIDPLTKKYHLLFLNTSKEKNKDDLKIYRFNNFTNEDYLDLRFYNTRNPEKDVVIKITYSIPEDKIHKGNSQLVNEL